MKDDEVGGVNRPGGEIRPYVKRPPSPAIVMLYVEVEKLVQHQSQQLSGEHEK
jgi:hypothetical protein